jgi:hypothetical protein
VSGGKTELLILVTPYVIRSDENMGEASSVYAGSINKLLKDRGPQVYTLLPWRSVFSQKPRTHGGRLLTPEGEQPEAPPPPAKTKRRP